MAILLIDFDGVLTDGKTYVNGSGEQFKSLNSRDNRAIKEFIAHGWEVHIVSASSWPGAKNYADKLGINFHKKRDKSDVLDITGEEYYAIGDDSWDINFLLKAKKAFCPSNAFSRVKDLKEVTILETPGGNGCIAELAEILLR